MVETATEEKITPLLVNLKIVGVGGGGGNAVRDIDQALGQTLPNIEFIAVNTDRRSLEHLAEEALPVKVNTVRIGDELTKGFGVGGDPEVGKKAAEESMEQLQQVASGADVIFIAAGMGGGTGSGVAPLLARMAKDTGALTVAIVTTPFAFEGEFRRKIAEEGIVRLLENVDTGIIIPNERLLSHESYKDPKKVWALTDAFNEVNKVLVSAVKAIAKIIAVPGIINLDLSDIRTVMKDGGAAVLAIGSYSGLNRAEEAARRATYNHFLGFPITGARKALIYVTARDKKELSLQEVQKSVEIIQRSVDPAANIRFGVGEDKKMEKEIEVTVIATGFITRIFAPTVKAEELRVPAKPSEPLKRSEPFSHLRELELDIPSFTRRTFPPQRGTSGATPPPAPPPQAVAAPPPAEAPEREPERGRRRPRGGAETP